MTPTLIRSRGVVYEPIIINVKLRFLPRNIRKLRKPPTAATFPPAPKVRLAPLLMRAPGPLDSGSRTLRTARTHFRISFLSWGQASLALDQDSPPPDGQLEGCLPSIERGGESAAASSSSSEMDAADDPDSGTPVLPDPM